MFSRFVLSVYVEIRIFHGNQPKPIIIIKKTYQKGAQWLSGIDQMNGMYQWYRNEFVFFSNQKIAVRRKDIGIWFGQARNKMQNWKYQIGDI